MIQDAILWPSISAIVAAILGVTLSRWFQRSKPWVGITSIQRDDSQLVNIPDDIVSQINNTPWCKNISNAIPLHRVIETADNANKGITFCKKIVDEVSKINALKKSGSSQKDISKKLLELFSLGYFRSVMEIMNDTGRLPIPDKFDVPDTLSPIISTEEIINEEGRIKAVVLLDGSGKRYTIESGLTLQNVERTKNLGTIIQYLIEPHFTNILNTIHNTMQNDLQFLLGVREQMTDLIKSRKLVVRAQITNLGVEPENIEPFGILKLKSAGKKIQPLIVAAHGYRVYESGTEELPRVMQILEGLAKKQDIEPAFSSQIQRGIPEYIAIKQGDIVQVDLITLDMVEDESIIEALANGMLSTQIILKRSGKKLTRWVSSKPQILGLQLSQERRDGLLKKGNK